jgi:hypothetical protein
VTRYWPGWKEPELAIKKKIQMRVRDSNGSAEDGFGPPGRHITVPLVQWLLRAYLPLSPTEERANKGKPNLPPKRKGVSHETV